MSDLFYERMLRGEEPLPMHQHTNHLPVHPSVVKKIQETVDSGEWVYYGGATGSADVKKIIAEDLNVDLTKYDILLTNGCIEAIYMIMHQFHSKCKSFVDCVPSWPWPRTFISAFNIPVEEVMHRKIQPDDIKPKSMVNLLNGQHPQSLLYTDKELIDLSERANEVGAWIIHDMTYRDFFPEYPNLLDQNPDRNFVVFSFSKANSLAGLRIGGLVCSKENAKKFFPLNPARLGVGVIAEKAVVASIKSKNLWKQQNIDKIVKNRLYVYENLKVLEERGILTLPKKDVMSDIWIDFHEVSSTWVTEELKKRGVCINDSAITAYGKRGVRGKNANHVTVTVSVPDYWIEYFCDQLRELFN